MVLVLYKVAALLLKVFSKPFIQMTKNAHLSSKAASSNPFFRKKFIDMGNTYNNYEQWLNKQFLKIQTEYAYKPLNDELAIEKGINFFYQIIFYIIIISIPIYELNRQSRQSKAKSKKLQQNITNLQTRFKHILSQIQIQKQALHDKKQKKVFTHDLTKLYNIHKLQSQSQQSQLSQKYKKSMQNQNTMQYEQKQTIQKSKQIQNCQKQSTRNRQNRYKYQLKIKYLNRETHFYPIDYLL